MDLTLFINTEHKHGDDLTHRFAEHADQVRAAPDIDTVASLSACICLMVRRHSSRHWNC